jgi:general stress protein CsbA
MDSLVTLVTSTTYTGIILKRITLLTSIILKWIKLGYVDNKYNIKTDRVKAAAAYTYNNIKTDRVKAAAAYTYNNIKTCGDLCPSCTQWHLCRFFIG